MMALVTLPFKVDKDEHIKFLIIYRLYIDYST